MYNTDLNFPIDNQDGISDISSHENNGKKISIPFESLSSDIFTLKQRENSVSHYDMQSLLLINKKTESQEQENIENTEKFQNDNCKDDNKNMNNELVSPQNNKTKICFITNRNYDSEKQQDNYLLQKKRKTGRKKGNDNSERKHNKYSDDNVRKKCKHIILDASLKFINDKIRFYYNDNDKNKDCPKELKTLNGAQISESNVEYNKKFLQKTLREIFSEDISSRCTSLPRLYNKENIRKLETEEDENKRAYFTNLFNLTFLQCMKHFIGTKPIKELDGMQCFDEIKDNYKDEQNYDKILKYYFTNYEEILNNKNARIKAKKEN